MKSLLFVVVALVGLAIADPPRPDISPFFSSHTFVEIRTLSDNKTVAGAGVYHIDQPAGKGLEFFDVAHNHSDNVYRLQRFDLGKQYTLTDKEHCVVSEVNGTMPNEWAWVSQATYKGQDTYKGRTFDIWEFTAGYATLTLGVETHDHRKPGFLLRKTPEKEIRIEFINFVIEHPASRWFEVPSVCQKQTDASEDELVGCLARSTMVARAQAWVNAHVPYNQGGHYDGYREDCSGYVSMCWETAKPGYVTSTLHDVSHPISKASLQPGDALLCASEHVVFFGGWANSAHTEYTAYEETRPGEGTVKRVTPYPYWYNTGCFLPYRYNSAC